MSRYNQIPSVFNKEQIYSLFDAIDNPEVMLACIIGIFCGLRVGEIIKLRYENIDTVKRQIKVLDGKMPYKIISGYGKDRLVPIPIQVLPLFIFWKNIHPDTEYLFTSLGKCDKHITHQHLFRNYKKALERAKLIIFKKIDAAGHKKNLYNFHTLRHTYATLLWERTGDIYAVKKALGHSDITMTMVYTHISDSALHEKVNAAFDIAVLHNNTKQANAPSRINITQESPMELLKIRLARGEIQIAEFKQLKNELI